MKLPSDFFSINGDPFTEEEISELKRTVDSSLPEDYLEFLSLHGGGVISETYSHLYSSGQTTQLLSKLKQP